MVRNGWISYEIKKKQQKKNIIRWIFGLELRYITTSHEHWTIPAIEQMTEIFHMVIMHEFNIRMERVLSIRGSSIWCRRISLTDSTCNSITFKQPNSMNLFKQDADSVWDTLTHPSLMWVPFSTLRVKQKLKKRKKKKKANSRFYVRPLRIPFFISLKFKSKSAYQNQFSRLFRYVSRNAWIYSDGWQRLLTVCCVWFVYK